MTDNTKPEALDLADWLEAVGGGPSAKRCAALLRAQHARIAELEARVQELGAMARENRSRRIVELEAQLEAVGAGGVQALRPEGGPPGSGGWQHHAEAMERERDHWRERARTMEEHQRGTVWYWQGDGNDHPESMVNSLPVVIRADQLRALSAAPEAKKSALRTYPNPIVPLIKPVSEQEKMRALYLASSNLMAYLGRNGAIHSDGHAADVLMNCLNDLDGGEFDETLFAASPTPPAEQQADPKAAPEEMDKEASNARLDIDSNSTEPEQQRDVACSLEVGQHVGNGEHQGASCRGSEDSELLKIAARNLKYFIERAQFSSFADKRAALNCLDALAAPPAEQQAAPKAEPGERLTRNQIREVFMAHGFTVKEGQTDLKQYVYDAAHALLELVAAPQQEAQEPWGACVSGRVFVGGLPEHARKLAEAENLPIQWLYRAPQPAPAPLSDDTKRLAWMADEWTPGHEKLYDKHVLETGGVGGLDDLRTFIDKQIAAQGGK